ncbi:uncharacterized protein A4U43_UnF4070 [Asparagus officinalis]|uniref:Metaxin n=1 Tax=Asparagus officinalis TaxID=4686 RepID=A0A1R3L6W3_ASPOF|nr:mitochondrial outer membrane import complex protein METAXIN-like [Asparagus officinalis]ONK55371.1 uncharacterized protein A4U43_UnF4070 [Asparagus officinalis]
MSERGEGELVLVARKGGFGLPTACPNCLPVYLYLRFANASFSLDFDVANPDSDHVPYIEYGDCVLFSNEKGGVIECLKGESIVDLDSGLSGGCVPHWLATEALISSWLAEAAQYELWVASNGSGAYKIYFSDLSWPVAKVLHWKQTQTVKQRLGITYLNANGKEEEIYRKAAAAYEALSQRLGEQTFFFDDRPTSLDAAFLGHALFVIHALPDTSTLRNNLLQYDNLVRYSENLKVQYVDSNSSSSIPRSSFGPSASSSSRTKSSSYWSSKSKPKAKREKTEEEKTFRRRANYFLATQLVAVLVFLSLFGGVENAEDDDEDELDYDD